MLYTRKDFDRPLAELMVGGIAIYAETDAEIVAALKAVETDLLSAFETPLCMTYGGFKATVCGAIEAERPERIFSAVFGSLISNGTIEIAECSGASGGIYRAFFLSRRRSELEAALGSAFGAILGKPKCLVKDVEQALFGKRAWGTWTQTTTIIDMLASVGLIRHVDRFTVEIAPGARNARSQLQSIEFNFLGGLMASG